MKKALIVSSYPAPYRVGVFSCLAKEYETDIYFDTCKNEDRNSKWFCKSDIVAFQVLDNLEARKDFDLALKNIKQYDFVIAYDPTRVPAMKAITRCRMKGVPYFVNNDGAILKKNFLKDAIKRFLFRGAIACFAAGKSSIKYYRYYGVDNDRIYLHKFSSLYNKDILNKPISSAERKSKRLSLNLPNMSTVVSVGQFIERKGFDVLLNAWKDLDRNAQLLLIGGGSEKGKYEEMIQTLNLKHVHLMGFMDKKNLFEYYMASDIFVLPTKEDIWGLVINEAMSVGLPIITTNKCNAGLELIDEGINGYIVPKGDINDLTDKMKMLLNSDSLRNEMGINNLKKIRDYTIENIAKGHIDIINSIVLQNSK